MGKIIWIDTRQKPKQWDWLKDVFIEKGYQIKDDKPMTYGDYCMPPNLSVLVDTKYDITEIVGNVIQQHDRFTRELQGAFDMGAKLYILILDEKVKCIEDLNHWENPRTKLWAIQKARAIKKGSTNYRKQPPTSGKQLAKILTTMQEKYHTTFLFCKRQDCADKIIELLESEEK